MPPLINEADIAELTAFAHELADLAGHIILPHFRARGEVHNKAGADGFDPVTQADREAERIMRTAIRKRFPNHNIVGEEFDQHDGDSAFTWVIDPIDGTRAFMCGMQQWGTLIALNAHGVPVLGLLDQPFTQERWLAFPGASTFRNCQGKVERLHTRRCNSLKGAILTTTSPNGYFDRREQEVFWNLAGLVKMTRFGGDCYAYGLLAMGFLDIIVEANLKPWDIQALIPIIENAGGVVTTWEGKKAYEGGRVVACGDPKIHAAVLDVLAAAR